MGNTPNTRVLPDGAGEEATINAALEPREDQAERLVVLSGDDAFVGTLERLASPHPVLVAAREADLGRTLKESPAAVAVLDSAAITSRLDRVTARLKLQFPQLVLIVAGTPQDEVALADQIARDTVYRFVPKPISAKRMKLFLDAAWLRHDDEGVVTEVPSGSGGTALRSWLIVSAVLATAVGGAFAVRKMMVAAPTNDTPLAATPGTSSTKLDDLLSQADAALAVGAFENAADLYRKAQQVSPNDPRPAQGLNRVVKRIIAVAQMQLLDRHIDRAHALANEALDLEPGNPQVSQLVAQISAAQDHAGAGASVPTAGAPAHPEAPPPKARLEDHLRRAEELMRQGRLIDPAQDSARSALRQARELAPNDPRVKLEQRKLLDLITIEARKAVANGHAEDAERFIAPAQELGARPEELANLTRDLARPSRNEAMDRFTAQFNERMKSGQILDPPNDSAKYYLAQLTRLDPNNPATQVARLTLGNKILGEAQNALHHQDVAGAKRWLSEARETGVDPTLIANVEADVVAAQAPPAAKSSSVSAAPLQRIKGEQPEYPASAASRRLKGYVNLQFTVLKDGSTANFAVLSSSPVGAFEQAATDAVRKWRYRPPTLTDGTPTEVRAEVKLNFAP